MPASSSTTLLKAPRGREGRREVQLEARVLGEPGLHFLGLMGLVVVKNEMEVEGLRHHPVDLLEEANKFFGTVARHAFTDDFAGLYVESCKQCRVPFRL